jgi:hypothetical protein
MCKELLSLKWFLLLPSSYMSSRCDFWMTGVVPRVPRSLRTASPPRSSPVEPSVRSTCDLIDVSLGSSPLMVVNLGAGLLGSSQPNTTSAIELTMDNYQEPTGDWSRSVPEELA